RSPAASRSTSARCNPRCASASLIPRPIPLAAPVTTATSFGSRRISSRALPHGSSGCTTCPGTALQEDTGAAPGSHHSVRHGPRPLLTLLDLPAPALAPLGALRAARSGFAAARSASRCSKFEALSFEHRASSSRRSLLRAGAKRRRGRKRRGSHGMEGARRVDRDRTLARYSVEARLNELKSRLVEADGLRAAAAVLRWDQTTYMPPDGAPARARQLAMLGRLAHESFTDPAIGALLEALR